MIVGLLGNKVGMTQIFGKEGEIIPVTIIKSGPCYVTQIKSDKTCGYNAIQVGYIEMESASQLKKMTKPELGHFYKANIAPFRYLKEYKIKKKEKTETILSSYSIGQKISVAIFQIGECVTITGFTIGKGNGGNIKTHHFHRGPMGHGSKHHRLQGSIGSGTTPGRVFPGKKMPGRLGMQKRTIKGLEIIDINEKENLLIVKGCIPGKSGNLVSIRGKNE